MPRLMSVEPLRQVCLQIVSENLDKLKWSPPEIVPSSSSNEDNNTGADGLTCFNCLPSRLVASIMDAVSQSTDHTLRTNEDLLTLLITTHLDRLNLSPYTSPLHGGSTKLDDQTILHLLRTAALRHSPLQSLGFAMSGAFPCLIFKDILPAFPNLKKLDVSDSSKTSVNDDFLALLATYCPNLEELRLVRCKGVTDAGIQQLCGHDDGNAGVVLGCKFLLQLNVEETGVSRHGARLALEQLPRLQIFDWPSTLHIASEMYSTNGTRQLNLKNLNASGRCVGDFNVPCLMDAALRLCPLVVHVNISGIENLLDGDLSALLCLNDLQSLTLDCCDGMSFNGGLLPILKKFGPSSLERLILIIVPEVNVGSIVEFCSELREICLDGMVHYIQEHRPGLRASPRRHFLPHLRRLTIKGYPEDLPEEQPSHADLSLLLSSAPDLERIDLHWLSKLSDGILEEAIGRHGFPKLESFQVGRCPGLTERVVDLLLDLDNPLSLISMEMGRTDSNGISLNNCWSEKIQENNWDVHIRISQNGFVWDF